MVMAKRVVHRRYSSNHLQSDAGIASLGPENVPERRLAQRVSTSVLTGHPSGHCPHLLLGQLRAPQRPVLATPLFFRLLKFKRDGMTTSSKTQNVWENHQVVWPTKYARDALG